MPVPDAAHIKAEYPATPGKDSKNMKKYKCLLCGYIYDPAEGDADNSIAPGTAFEDLPDDWVCPECGAAKTEFEPLG